MSAVATAVESDRIERALLDPRRLEAVRETGLLDSPSELFFDRLTRLAAGIVHAPAAFLTILDSDRNFYKSSFGFDGELAGKREMRGATFCHHTLISGGKLVVNDARAEPSLRAIPTIRTLGVVAYLGVVLSVRRQAVGAFCVIDRRPRRWSHEEVESIVLLARAANAEISARTHEREAAGAALPARKVPEVSEAERRRIASLSRRELEVLSHFLAGRRIKEIAFELGVNDKTITTYRTRMLRKLELQNERELVVFAVRNRLVQW